MPNRVIVKFSFIAAMFVFASCHNDVPELPSPNKVKGFKFCKYEDKEGYQCKSTYEIYESDCTASIVGGKIFCDENCTELCPELPNI